MHFSGRIPTTLEQFGSWSSSTSTERPNLRGKATLNVFATGKEHRSLWMPISLICLDCGSATSRKAQVRRDRSRCLAGRAFNVHGTVTTKLNPNGTVAVKMDTFDFDLKPWYGNFTRNVYTLALRVYVGPGTPFNVYFRGTVPIAP
jgi:hypothetical protein